MKTLHYFMLMLIVATFSITTHSCSDSDNDDDWSQEVNDEASKQFFEEAMTQSILLSLCDVDSLDNGGVKYTPRIGRKLYDSKPTVYYTIANTLEEAESTYQRMVAGLNTLPLEAFYQPHEVQQGDIHLIFSESKESGETARLTIDCPRLRDVLTEIVFLTEERWPQNDKSTPFRFGSLWRHAEDGTTRLYLCVRTCKSSKGIMLTFDGGWGKDYFTKADPDYQKEFYLFTKTASSDAFDALARMMSYNDSMYNHMLGFLKQTTEYKQEKTVDSINGKKGSMFVKLCDGKEYYFDHSYSYERDYTWIPFCGKCYYYIVNLQRSKFFYENKIWKIETYNRRWTKGHTPEHQIPSHEIIFDYGFDNGKGWEQIYKGT